ncbi:diguanylate cyclase [Sporofaciens sp. SGI.106]|uniref:sensor domain-containing diguanylate cyclase n=1 Tax=Sporofaciens sp. SGI.106 TaxID=3420568 RepID=UPI003CFFD86F
MKNNNALHKMVFPIYLVVLCCTALLLIHLGVDHHNDVIQLRKDTGYRSIKELSYTEINNFDAPAGIQKEYILNIDNVEGGENCLAFYLVHSYAQIYIDDEMVYSLQCKDGGSSGETVGCKWIFVPVTQFDSGKQIRVVITPVYKAVSKRSVEFYVGSRYAIIASRLLDDLSDIILSFLAVLMGGIFILISVFSWIQRKKNISLFYLGLFSCFLGTWKITDIRSASLMFKNNPMLVSQISLIMLGISVVPFVCFIRKQFEKNKYVFLDVICYISIISVMLQVMLQFFGIMDLRETLFISHLVIATAAVAVTLVVLNEFRKKKRSRKVWITLGCFLLCVVGATIDLIFFYVNGTSHGTMSMIAVFLIYIAVMGAVSIAELNQQATIDYSTGLFNRSRCRELLSDQAMIQGEVCLMMFDLNQLKMVNDTQGHEAGDYMISQFAEVLRRNTPARAFLGRYGGDEFIAVIRKCDNEHVLKILKNISDEVKKHNQSDMKVKVDYSVGYSISTEFEECTMEDLLEKADCRMYEDKRAYYEKLGMTYESQK